MGCAFEEDLTAFVDGELPAVRAKALEGHLPTCASCRATEGLLRRTVVQLTALPAPAFTPNPRLRREVLARLDPQEAPQEARLLTWLKALLRPVVVFPSLGALAATVLALVLVSQHREATDTGQFELASELEVVRNLDVLEDYEVLGMDSAEDLDVVQNLDELGVKP